MNIGIDCHNLEGQRTGVGRYTRNLLMQWSNKDFVYNYRDRDNCIQLFLYFKKEIPEDVKSLGFTDEKLAGEKLEYSHDRENIRICKWNFRALGGRSNAMFKHWLLPRAAARDNVDILFCPDYLLPFYVGFRKSHIKTAVTIHDISYEAQPAEYSWPSFADKILLKLASKQSAKKADVIFAPSEFTKSEILKYYHVRPEKVRVTPLAADPQFKKIDMPGEVAGEKLSVGVLEDWEKIGRAYNIQGAYILFVGSIFNRRFLPQCIEGFTRFTRGCKDFSSYGGSPAGRQFLIVGRNHTRPYQDIGALVAEANQKLGREAVAWREYVSDEELVYLYNGAFVTLWLSSYEGFGLPILESMACGTPVITSMKGALPEVAGDAAMYVAHPENPEEISNALTHLARYGSYRDELILKGLLQAAKFSWQKTAAQTLDNFLQYANIGVQFRKGDARAWQI